MRDRVQCISKIQDQSLAILEDWFYFQGESSGWRLGLCAQSVMRVMNSVCGQRFSL